MRHALWYTLLLPAITEAQAQIQGNVINPFHKAQPGSYVLNADRQVAHTGQLMVYADGLFAKDEAGKVYKYHPDEVYRVQIGQTRFIAVKEFQAKPSLGLPIKIRNVFVEVLDSGKVSLYCHSYQVSAPNGVQVAYMLHPASTDSIVTLPTGNFSGKGKQFRAVLEPYLVSRPDLLQLVDEGTINIHTLPALLHAFNTGQPYVPPKPKSYFGGE